RGGGERVSPLGARCARGSGGAGHLVAPAARRGAGTSRTMRQLPALVGVFAYLSLLTVGGGLAAFPELKALSVERFHWLTTQQLIHLYSLGQVAPGPNMMMVAAVGERVAGGAGRPSGTSRFSC